MTHDHPHHASPPDDHEHAAVFDTLLDARPVNLAALVRACADGELTSAQCDRLEAYLDQHPHARSQIHFERALRSCCRRALSAPRCPDALRSRVMAIAAQSSDAPISQPQTSHTPADGPDSAPPRRPAPAPLQTQFPTRQRSFWARSPVLGIAAALLLGFAGVLIWQSVSFSNTAATVPGLNIAQAAYYNRVSDFVVREHNRCCQDQAARAKLIRRDVTQAVAYFSQQFGHRVSVPDMSSTHGQLEFFGGGDCQLPSTTHSGHLRFDAIDDQGNAIAMSLFIAPDPGLLPLEEGHTYQLKAQACDQAGARLFAWVSNGIQYLLVSEAPDEMCTEMRRVMNAPAPMSSI